MQNRFVVSALFGGLLAGMASGAYADSWLLSEVPRKHIMQEWGMAWSNRSVEGNPLKVGGVTYENGIGTHAAGFIGLQLDGRANRISGLVGVDDEVGSGSGSVIFRIVNGDDGRVLWQSRLLKSGMAAEPFDVTLAGVNKLELVTADGGDGNGYDHADWLEVKIDYDGAAPVALADQTVVTTDHLQWMLKGTPGGGLLQWGLEGQMQDNGIKMIDALVTFPPRYSEGFILPSNLKVAQADGSYNLSLQFQSQEIENVSDDVVRQTYHLVDPKYPVAVDLIVTAYQREDVLESVVAITNRGDRPIEVMDRDSVFVAFPAREAYLTNFNGTWGAELTGWSEDKVPRGIVEHHHFGLDQTAWPDYPGMFLSFGQPAEEDSGDVFAAAIAWSGNWQYKVTRLPDDRIFFSGGAVADPIKLAPGESYRTPRVIMTYSTAGKGQASRNLHRFARRYGIMNGEKERPVVLNSWEGVYFTFDEKKLIDMMDGAAALGAEMFVLDDGWFGNEHPRNNDKAGLGDWQVNKSKLPGGLEKLIEEAHQRGLQFGLWVEPEMVNPASNLYEAHPDWVMRIPNRETYSGRNQYLLDMSKPEVEEFIYRAVSDILKAHPGIKYIKWDHNMPGLNGGAAHLGDNQGALSDKHNQAYYRIMERLRRDFPDVMFQLCSSGGGRIDYGAMKYSDEFWTSDETNAIKRIPIQWGVSHFFPSNAMASHIGRYGEGDFKLRADVSMTGRLGIELDPDVLSEADHEVVKRGIAAYKELRGFLHSADLYRGRSPFDSQTTELTFVGPDKKEAVFFAFKRDSGARTETLVMKGLDPNGTYRLTEVNPDDEPRFTPGVFSGRELMEKGIAFRFPEKPSSAVVKLLAE